MNLTSVFVSGVSGATLGAKADTAIETWFGGVGAIPGAIIGGAVGGICGSFGASWIGVGTVVYREVIKKTLPFLCK